MSYILSILLTILLGGVHKVLELCGCPNERTCIFRFHLDLNEFEPEQHNSLILPLVIPDCQIC